MCSDEKPIRKKSINRGIIVSISLGIFFYACGYISNRMSVETCERRTIQDLCQSRWIKTGTQIKVLPNRRAEKTSQWLTKLNVTHVLLTEEQVEGVKKSGVSSRIYFPWINIGETHTYFPFIVSVEYGWVAEPQIGSGGSKRYFCLFGCVIYSWTSVTWNV